MAESRMRLFLFDEFWFLETLQTSEVAVCFSSSGKPEVYREALSRVYGRHIRERTSVKLKMDATVHQMQ